MQFIDHAHLLFNLPETPATTSEILTKNPDYEYSNPNNPPNSDEKWKWDKKHKEWIPICYRIYDSNNWIAETRGHKKKEL